jgi:His-Xaa-Ser system protein HxsD
MQKRFSWIEELTDGSLSFCVDTAVYSLEALFRVCYIFTDKCYLYLEVAEPASVIRVNFSQKTSKANLEVIAGEFSNELINQRVRMDVATETRAIRELIVAQAFAESSVVDTSLSDSSYLDDPKGIAQ